MKKGNKHMNNDLISRKWLTDAIRNRRTYLSYEDAKDVIDLINNAPTVDIKDEIAGAYNEGYMCGSREAEKAKKPQGEWIDCKEFPYLANCSNCGYQMDTHEEHGYFKFCPNCGADMRKGGENNV